MFSFHTDGYVMRNATAFELLLLNIMKIFMYDVTVEYRIRDRHL